MHCGLNPVGGHCWGVRFLDLTAHHGFAVVPELRDVLPRAGVLLHNGRALCVMPEGVDGDQARGEQAEVGQGSG